MRWAGRFRQGRRQELLRGPSSRAPAVQGGAAPGKTTREGCAVPCVAQLRPSPPRAEPGRLSSGRSSRRSCSWWSWPAWWRWPARGAGGRRAAAGCISSWCRSSWFRLPRSADGAPAAGAAGPGQGGLDWAGSSTETLDMAPLSPSLVAAAPGQPADTERGGRDESRLGSALPIKEATRCCPCSQRRGNVTVFRLSSRRCFETTCGG